MARDAAGCIEEAADLLYHLTVLMEAKGFGWDEVVDVLAKTPSPLGGEQRPPPRRTGRGVAAARTCRRRNRLLAAPVADHDRRPPRTTGIERVIVVRLQPAFDDQVERSRRQPRIGISRRGRSG